MSVLKKWEVMKAFEEGAAIEYKDVRCEEWIACIEPAWNWGLSDYRVKLQKWQPSANGDFYVTSDNQIGDYPSSNHVDFGVVFETVVRAKEASVVFRRFHRLYQLALDLNKGWTPDWDDDNQKKYFVEYDHLYNEWHIEYVGFFKTPNGIYFKSKEIAKRAIRMIEEGALE